MPRQVGDMAEKKVYPRPAAPPAPESFSHRPSSPVFAQHPSPSPRSFFSRSAKPPKPKSEGQRIPWEPSYPVSPVNSPARPSPPPPLAAPVPARPSSPLSTSSYTSSNSSSRWSHTWATDHTAPPGFARSQDVFHGRPTEDAPSLFERGGGWSEDEDEDSLISQSVSATKKGSGSKRAFMRHAFGLEKKTSTFSLRGLMRGRGGPRDRDSLDHDFSPPPSPTLAFPGGSPRTASSLASIKSSKRANILTRAPPRSPLLPLPNSPPRERSVSSPTLFPSPESAGIHGKAARLLGEEVVPHGKAARLLGLERKPTLRQRPSVNSLADSTFTDASFAQSTPSPRTSPPDPSYNTPSSTNSPRLVPSDPVILSAPPRVLGSTTSPSRMQHRHNSSASDPFWQTTMAQQHQAGLHATSTTSTTTILESSIEEEESFDASPVVPQEGRFSSDSCFPTFPSPPSDPTDSVYISDSRNHSSLFSISLDLNHLSTFSSASNLDSLLAGESPVEERVTRTASSSRPYRRRVRSLASLPEDVSGATGPDSERCPRVPSSRLSELVSQDYSTAATPTTSSFDRRPQIGPPPSTALPPVPPSSSTSLPNLEPRHRLVFTCGPLLPLGPLRQSLPRIPSLEPLPSFLNLDGTNTITEDTTDVLPGATTTTLPALAGGPQEGRVLSENRRPTCTTPVLRPTRSNTVGSVASVSTRTRQLEDALDQLEGRSSSTTTTTKTTTATATGATGRKEQDREDEDEDDDDHGRDVEGFDRTDRVMTRDPGVMQQQQQKQQQRRHEGVEGMTEIGRGDNDGDEIKIGRRVEEGSVQGGNEGGSEVEGHRKQVDASFLDFDRSDDEYEDDEDDDGESAIDGGDPPPFDQEAEGATDEPAQAGRSRGKTETELRGGKSPSTTWPVLNAGKPLSLEPRLSLAPLRHARGSISSCSSTGSHNLSLSVPLDDAGGITAASFPRPPSSSPVNPPYPI